MFRDPSEGLLDELARRLNVAVTDDGDALVFPDATVYVQFGYGGPGHVLLDSIAAHPQGTGAGTRVMHALMTVAAERNLPVKLFDVKNPVFFTRLGFDMDTDRFGLVEGLWKPPAGGCGAAPAAP